MTMQQILNVLAYYREMHTSARPWTHYSKKGPGRKHQQRKRN